MAQGHNGIDLSPSVSKDTKRGERCYTVYGRMNVSDPFSFASIEK